MRAAHRPREIEDLHDRGRLAAARFADQPERLALADVEADAVDGAHAPDAPPQHRALHQRIALHEAADLEHRARWSRGTAIVGACQADAGAGNTSRLVRVARARSSSREVAGRQMAGARGRPSAGAPAPPRADLHAASGSAA